MKKSKVILIFSILGVVIISLMAILISLIFSASNYEIQLENMYKRSLLELTNNINDIEVDMSKLIATNSKDSQREVLTNVYNDCSLANNNISCLPIDNHKINKVNKFINNLGGYAYSLITYVNKNDKLTNEHFKNIEKLYEHSKIMSYEVNNYFNNLKYDYKILKDINYNNATNSNFDAGFTNVQNTASKVPTLIYDGPFSESVINKEIKGLNGEIISKEQGVNILKEKFKNYALKNISYINFTNGKFETFNYNVELKTISLYVQLSKKGGTVVNITGTGSGGDKNLSVQECVTIAQIFAKDLGFKDMYSVWNAENNGIIYVNLAPIKNRVIYYPDLVKVKINQKSGVIIGLDATNYCYNHIERNFKAPKLTFEEAEKKLSPLLTCKERNLALISNKFVGETLTYEFICSWQDCTYYVYINCYTGEECNIMKVIRTNSGNLIM